jgi:hypothetical protein
MAISPVSKTPPERPAPDIEVVGADVPARSTRERLVPEVTPLRGVLARRVYATPDSDDRDLEPARNLLLYELCS